MIRLFHVYIPVRTFVLFWVEAVLVCCSFLLATFIRMGSDTTLVLAYENGLYKILLVCIFALVLAHYFDLYDLQRLTSSREIYFRILLVVGIISLSLGAAGYLFPGLMLPGNCFTIGLFILTVNLFIWRSAYSWLVSQPYLSEKVFVVGAGERARLLVEGLRKRRDFGIAVTGWGGALGVEPSREEMAQLLINSAQKGHLDRVIVAMGDRRGALPVEELLELRLSGVKIEDATTLLEKIYGKIELDQLRPSWLIFSEGFWLNPASQVMRRMVSILVSLTGLIIALPLLPFIALVVKLSSPGEIFYRQKRVGQHGTVFYCYKFRTMRADAEADSGATWASDDDPRITKVGKFLRTTRLDEIPQLWNVLRGDMGFVGPRPERPEFVEWLSREIPFYRLRNVIRPGLTGWAQVRYKYGNTVQDSKEKLQYDLFYIKNCSLGLDLLIMFETVKTVLLGRGAQ